MIHAPERIWTLPYLAQKLSEKPEAPSLIIQMFSEYIRADIAATEIERLQARVAELQAVVASEIAARSVYESLPPDRGGHRGPKGVAHAEWFMARSRVVLALGGKSE